MPVGAAGEELRGVTLSREWKAKAAAVARGEDGRVVFEYGAGMPTVVCAPLFVCDVQLQPGEVVNRIDMGDAVRWKVSPSMTGSGANATTHIILKPTEPDLVTNMMIATERRLYHLKLVSSATDWMPVVSFSYGGDDNAAAWQAYQRQQQERQDAERQQTAASNAMAGAVSGTYHIQGPPVAWRPVRVTTDGVKTYIQFPPEARYAELPALLGQNDRQEDQLVNYRLVGDTYVVDKVLSRGVLIMGVGRHQRRITLVRQSAVSH